MIKLLKQLRLIKGKVSEYSFERLETCGVFDLDTMVSMRCRGTQSRPLAADLIADWDIGFNQFLDVHLSLNIDCLRDIQ